MPQKSKSPLAFEQQSSIAGYLRKGVLVDSNILLLMVLGSFAPQRIETFARTSAYTEEDFILLSKFLMHFSSVFTTPHVLTEVSDLGNKLPASLLPGFHLALRALVEKVVEVTRASREIVATKTFVQFGLTDAAISLLALNQHLVLTADSALASYLSSKGAAVVDFEVARSIMRES